MSRPRTIIGRRSALVILLVVTALAALTLTACGTAPYSAGSTPDIAAAAAKAGAVVLDQGTAKNYYPGGDKALWYILGKEGSEKAAAVVSVLTFDTERDRDAAVRQMVNDTRAGSPRKAVYTSGNALVRVDRVKDKAVVRELDKVMRDAGMK